MSVERPHSQDVTLTGEALVGAANELYDQFDKVTSSLPPYNNYDLFLKFVTIFNADANRPMQYPPVMSFKDDEGRLYECRKGREAYKNDEYGKAFGAEKYIEKRWFLTITDRPTEDGQHIIRKEGIVNLELVNSEPIFRYESMDLKGGWKREKTSEVNNGVAVKEIRSMLSLMHEKIAAKTLRSVHPA